MKKILVSLMALAVASPAFAEVKAYRQTDTDYPNGQFNILQRSPQLTPSVFPPASGAVPENSFGSYFLEDDSGGAVTLSSLVTGSTGLVATTTNSTGFMGNPPGAYLWIRSVNTTTVVGGQSGVGSSTTEINWGVLSGWTATGGEFCKSTPPALCTFISRFEDATQAAVLPSSTYDIGTWTFDGAGDFTSSGYIRGTQNGGISNTVQFSRGTFFGSSLPVLPVLGFGALALGLGVAGVRATRRG